jgi:hypothetical protein
MNLTKIAVFGHSFGGGAVPAMALNMLSEGWGSSGLAMYSMAVKQKNV